MNKKKIRIIIYSKHLKIINQSRNRPTTIVDHIAKSLLTRRYFITYV